jgi:hypothetical protein
MVRRSLLEREIERDAEDARDLPEPDFRRVTSEYGDRYATHLRWNYLLVKLPNAPPELDYLISDGGVFNGIGRFSSVEAYDASNAENSKAWAYAKMGGEQNAQYYDFIKNDYRYYIIRFSDNRILAEDEGRIF